MSSPYFKIFDIYFPLNNYTFDHGINEELSNERFVGRKGIKERLKHILNSSKSDKGAYLVTGYRGIGKTSLINHVLLDEELKNKYEVIRLSLSQDEVKDIDLLRQIAWKLCNNIDEKFFFKPEKRLISVIRLLTNFIAFYILSLLFGFPEGFEFSGHPKDWFWGIIKFNNQLIENIFIIDSNGENAPIGIPILYFTFLVLIIGTINWRFRLRGGSTYRNSLLVIPGSDSKGVGQHAGIVG